MRYIRFLLLITFTIISIPPAPAQDVGLQTEKVELIKERPLIPYLSNQYRKNDQQYPMGLTYKKMAFEFEQMPKAMIHYQLAHRKAKEATAFTFVGLGAILAGTQILISDNQQSDETTFNHSTLSYTISIAGAISLITGQFIFYNSRKDLNLAIRKRNQELLLLR